MGKWTRAVSVIAAALLIAAVILLAQPNEVGSANRVERGVATTYGPGYEGLLALPEGKGHRVRICSSESGSRLCVTKTSNDIGPSLARQRAGVIVDLDVPTFEGLCKCGWRTGVIDVTVEYLEGGAPAESRPTLPPTDTG